MSTDGFYVLVLLAGCASESDTPNGEGTAGTGGVAGVGGNAGAAPDVSIDLSSATPRSLLWSVGYWTWARSFDDPVEGTEELLAPLKPQLIRIGGYHPDSRNSGQRASGHGRLSRDPC